MPERIITDAAADTKGTGQSDRASKIWRSRKNIQINEEPTVLKDHQKTVSGLVLSLTMVRKYTFLYIVNIYYARQNRRAWERSIYRLLGWDGDAAGLKIFRNQLWRQIISLRNDFGVKIVRLKSPKEEQEGEGSAYYKIADYGVFNPYNLNKMLDQNSLIFEKAVLNLMTTSKQGVKNRIRPEA